MSASRKIPIANGLLAALTDTNYRRLLPGLEPVALTFGEVLYEPGDRIRHVYFPGNSLVSLLTRGGSPSGPGSRHGRPRGAGRRSGGIGRGVSPVRALVQGAGTALRMTSARFRKELGKSPQLQDQVHGYAETLLAQITRIAACNRFHVVEARLARWLLMTRDRVRSDQFRLTQEFLAHMLGVRRVGVTKAAVALQARKLIDYSRGTIRILDRKGLEACACSCYATMKGKRGGARA